MRSTMYFQIVSFLHYCKEGRFFSCIIIMLLQYLLTCTTYFSDVTAVNILYSNVAKNAETFIELVNQPRRITLTSHKLFSDISNSQYIIDQKWPEVKEFRSSGLNDKRMKIKQNCIYTNKVLFRTLISLHQRFNANDFDKFYRSFLSKCVQRIQALFYFIVFF